MNPSDLVKQNIKDHLLSNYTIDKNIHVIGFGKAAVPMVLAAEAMLFDDVMTSFALVPHNTHIPKVSNLKTKFIFGAKNNLPDDKSIEGTKIIMDNLLTIPKEHIIIFLISGGGSSLLEAPIPNVSIKELVHLILEITQCGADISQLNRVRQALSTVKGGQLIEKTKGPKISFILSDIVNDPVNLIASGPTFIDVDKNRKTRYFEAMSTLTELNLNVSISISTAMRNYAFEKYEFEEKSNVLEELKSSVKNIVIGNNKKALSTLKEELEHKIKCFIVTDELQNEASVIGRKMADIISSFSSSNKINLNFFNKTDYDVKDDKIALLFGGEWVMKMKRNNNTNIGLGGRNQHLILTALQWLILNSKSENLKDFLLISFNTDGNDGKSPENAAAAGAFINKEDVIHFQGVDGDLSDLEDKINSYDSYNFWSNYRNGAKHFITSKTNTNLMDILVLVLDKSKL
uniref:DUF4147 domain-containing protein n=1 Tax=Rhabditophanes sp. KR3021 TaxID=114890 RepID=A0AC35UH89_9BILA